MRPSTRALVGLLCLFLTYGSAAAHANGPFAPYCAVDPTQGIDTPLDDLNPDPREATPVYGLPGTKSPFCEAHSLERQASQNPSTLLEDAVVDPGLLVEGTALLGPEPGEPQDPVYCATVLTEDPHIPKGGVIVKGRVRGCAGADGLNMVVLLFLCPEKPSSNEDAWQDQGCTRQGRAERNFVNPSPADEYVTYSVDPRG